jgi:hypothetical protein
MSAYDGFTPDNTIPSPAIPPDNWIYKHQIPEQPLTHHQQAVKDFMIAIVSSRDANWEFPVNAEFVNVQVAEQIASTAKILADAFINQINKK